MKENNTYSSPDIEELLGSKSFEKLTKEEKIFALSQVDSEQEYKELRQTLISIKKISSEQETIVVPNKIKADLMEMMEQKKKPFVWFNLNKIGAFLFPSNTSLFQKPGLQFATLALLLLLVVNIGIDFVKQPNKVLAINETSKEINKDCNNDNKKLQDSKQEESKGIVENRIIKKDIEEQKKEVQLLDPVKPVIDHIEDVNEPYDGLEDKLSKREEEFISMDEEIIIEEVVKVEKVAAPSRNNERDKAYYSETEDFEEVANKDKRLLKKESVPTSIGNVSTTFFFDTVHVTKVIKATKLKSQNLADNAEVIDLLFVAM